MKTLLCCFLWALVTFWNDDGQPRTEQTRLIIYRQREFGGNEYTIKINDKKVGTLPTNRYLQLDLPAGRIKIESIKDYFSENQTLWLSTEPGRTYYVKAVEEIDFMTRTLLLAPVADAQAQRDLQRVKPQAPTTQQP